MRSNIAKRAAAIGWPILVTALILLAWEISVRTLGIRSIILPPSRPKLCVRAPTS